MTPLKSARADEQVEMDDTTTSGSESSRSETTAESSVSGSKAVTKKKQDENSSQQSRKALAYKYMGCYQEVYNTNNGVRHQSSFAISINNHLGRNHPIVFATTGQNRINLYQCEENGEMTAKFCYIDPDPEEIFYCCDWSYDKDTGEAIVAAAGLRGIIRILNAHQFKCTGTFIGHGHCINDLKFHPMDPNLLLSCSKDHDIRLWNIKTCCNVAIFGGLEGHRDEVLSVDFFHDGSMFISSSMDHSLKIWKLNKTKVEDAITRSYNAPNGPMGHFNTEEVNFPDYSTREIHSNYIDCCKWFGDLVISKSCENRVVIWKPSSLQKDEVVSSTNKASAMRELELEQCEIWFVRFAICEEMRIMALGNEDGKIFVWDLCSPDFTNMKYRVLSHQKTRKIPIRQIALSADNRVLIALSDTGLITRWEKPSGDLRT